MNDVLYTLATTTDPAQQKAVGRAFLLIVVLILIGVIVVLGLLMAGFAWHAKNSTEQPKRKDRYKGIDAWEEAGRRAEPERDEFADTGGDWEADDDA